MNKSTTPAGVFPAAIVEEAWQQVGASFERFCLTAGIASLAGRRMRPGCAASAMVVARPGWASLGEDQGKARLPRGQSGVGATPSAGPQRRRDVAAELGRGGVQDWLGKWAMNLMLINVSTRKNGRAVRLPESDRRAQRFRPVQIGGVAPVCGTVGRTHEGVDGRGSVEAGPAGDPDRRHPHHGRPGAAGRRWR